MKSFGEKYISFRDPDGLKINLIATAIDNGNHEQTNEIRRSILRQRGFHNVTLLLKDVTPTAKILTDIFGYKLLKQEVNRYRFITDAIENASIVDIIEAPNVGRGVVAGGTNHHVAFRVKDDNILMDYREKIESIGLNISSKKT